MLQYHFNWKTLSAMAGVTWWNFYFRLFPGAIRSPQVVEFLRHLMRHLRGRLLIVWDGLRAYRSFLRNRNWLPYVSLFSHPPRAANSSTARVTPSFHPSPPLP